MTYFIYMMLRVIAFNNIFSHYYDSISSLSLNIIAISCQHRESMLYEILFSKLTHSYSVISFNDIFLNNFTISLWPYFFYRYIEKLTIISFTLENKSKYLTTFGYDYQQFYQGYVFFVSNMLHLTDFII